MLLIVEKGIRRGIYRTIYQHVKPNDKYMKNYDINKESSHLGYWDVNDLHGWEISQKLPVNYFKCIEGTSQFNKNFIKIYNEDSDIGYFIEVDVLYPGKLYELYNGLLFLPERMKIEKIEKLAATKIFIIFCDFLIFYQVFLPPQVKRRRIISNEHGIYELPHELPNNLRLTILVN